jgi:hypothetical protein
VPRSTGTEESGQRLPNACDGTLLKRFKFRKSIAASDVDAPLELRPGHLGLTTLPAQAVTRLHSRNVWCKEFDEDGQVLADGSL